MEKRNFVIGPSRTFTMKKVLVTLATLLLMTQVGFPLGVPTTGKVAGHHHHQNEIKPTMITGPSLAFGVQDRAIINLRSPGKFSFGVVGQPQKFPSYVSDKPEIVTRFSLAEQHGSLGFLAHNYLAGKAFFSLVEGDPVYLEYQQDDIQRFVVMATKEYQALSPYDPYSTFIDLDSGAYLSASELFYEVYAVKGQLVLQTCIEKNGIDTWGRYFVIAQPDPEETKISISPLIVPLWHDLLN